MIAEALLWLLALALLSALWFAPRFGLAAVWREAAMKRLRRRFEDGLKHMLAWERRGKIATPESIAGSLGRSPRQVLTLITRMESKGLVSSGADGVRLTPEGERLALHVVRAHRLLERYLADEAGLPMSRLHQAAEKAEHELSPEGADRLDAHLGHPQRDPHGDPIPTSHGEMPKLDGATLTEWPVGRPARIVHIEDEPAVIFEQSLAAGLKPGMTLWVVEDSRAAGGKRRGSRAPAGVGRGANIQVTDAAPEELRASDAVRLSSLPLGVRAEVLARQRLPRLRPPPVDGPGDDAGAVIEPALRTPLAIRGYRLRGTMIALRRQQAGQVWVRPLRAERGGGGVSAKMAGHDCEACPAHVQLAQMGVSLGNADHLVALAGNPNTGKSSVFNALTGLRQHVGNWTGKTVARAEGGYKLAGKSYKLVDLPGSYSLLSASQDEEIARNFLLFGRPDCTIVVLDATALERNLNLALQVMEITDRVVLCVNLMDEARRKGLDVDVRSLSRDMGVPAVPTVARTKEGLPQLVQTVADVIAGRIKTKPLRVQPPPEVAAAPDDLTPLILEAAPGLPNALGRHAVARSATTTCGRRC